jgi:peptide/nickel transport system permease protein
VTGTFLRRAFAHPAARLGLVLAGIALLAAVLGPWLLGSDPLAVLDPVHRALEGPSAEHPLGTDALSRDVLARLLHGARVSLGIGITASLLGVLIGGVVGLGAVLGGARVDAVLMRGVDVFLALPRVFLLMVVFALWERPGPATIVGVIALTGWFETARLVRAHARTLMGADFVTAVTALGGGRCRIARHLLPHVGATAIVSATLDVGSVILLEAGLSFLGLGLRPPTPTWGNMIFEGRSLLFTAPWVALAPGIALTLTVLACNLLGDALRDALDPRQASSR